MGFRRSLSFDGKLFFLYDREAVTSEADPPENAIIYFYPTSATIEDRISICGQLVGMSNFLSTVLDFAPVMINLKTEKVALYQSGQYTLALGGTISEPETLLMRQLQTLFDVFVFFHGSLDTVRKLSCDHSSFLTNMSIIWDCYLHFVRHYGDTLPAVFNPLPFLKAPENSSQRCFLKACHILQACQRRHHILGGCILHQKSVLCTQLETSITKRLLLLKPNQSHHPGKQVNTEIKLPFGVRFLDSFVTCCEYEQLINSLKKSPYHNSIKVTQPRSKLDKSPQRQSAKEQIRPVSNQGRSIQTKHVGEEQHEVQNIHSIDTNQGTKAVLGQLEEEEKYDKETQSCEGLDNIQPDEKNDMKPQTFEGIDNIKPDEKNDMKLQSCEGIDNLEPQQEKYDLKLKNCEGLDDIKPCLDENQTKEGNGIVTKSIDTSKGFQGNTSLDCSVDSFDHTTSEDICSLNGRSCYYNENDDKDNGGDDDVVVDNDGDDDDDDVGDDDDDFIDDEELTMDEVDVTGLRIVNGPYKGSNEHENIDPLSDDVKICSEIINSLIDKIINDCEMNLNASMNSSIVSDVSSESISNKEVNTPSPNIQSDENIERIQTTIPVSTNEKSQLGEEDCYCYSDENGSDILETSHQSPHINLPGVPSSILAYTTLQESVCSPVEEFHDTFEDLTPVDNIKFTPRTVDAYLHSYHDLRTNHGLMHGNKYSTRNINHPDHKNYEKSFFKDLVNTETHSCKSRIASNILNHSESSTSQEQDSREISGSGQEPASSHLNSSESTTSGPCKDSALGDSGLCLYHGSSESSLSQPDSVENGSNLDLQQSSSDMKSEYSSSGTLDLEMSTNTVKEADDKQEGQAKYVDELDESLYQIDGLVHINLYVQAHSNTVLILLADSCLSQDQETIKALWKTSLNELGELEVHLNQCSKTGVEHHDKPDDYGFIVYDSITSTTKGNLSEPVEQVDFKFCDTAKIVHEQLNSCSSLKAVTLRDDSIAVHCQRSLGQEVYFNKKGVLKPSRGTPSDRDSTFTLERRARKQLKKFHGINVI